jgi:hypothetical protein
MNFARPPTGFIVTEPANFDALIQGYAQKWPRVVAYWAATKARLKMTGHKEGAAVGGNLSNRVFEAEGDAASQLPTIRVAYHVLGDKLEFKKLVVLDPPAP